MVFKKANNLAITQPFIQKIEINFFFILKFRIVIKTASEDVICYPWKNPSEIVLFEEHPFKVKKKHKKIIFRKEDLIFFVEIYCFCNIYLVKIKKNIFSNFF